MVKSQELEQLKKAEKISIKEGSFAGIMDGFGSRYITPYALALGASNFIIALISTLPNLIGNLTQLHILTLMKKKSRKKIVFRTVLTQALLWIPIILVGILYFLKEESRPFIPFFLLVAYSLMVIAGTSCSPAWNSWMKDIILSGNGKYFGKRNRIVNIVAIVSMLIAGLILTFFTKEKVLIGFFIIFSIAFLGRIISAYFLTRQYEPSFSLVPSAYFSLKSFIKKIPNSNFGKFVIFVSAITLATAVAGPFFVVYMLKDLGLTYFQFTLVTISSVITTILSLPSWGKFADKFGNLKVLKVNGLLISLIPFMWVFTLFIKDLGIFPLLSFLILLEFFSGFVWAGFNLSAGMFIYDAVTREKMAFCVAYFNIINSFGTFIGALIGGFLSSFHISPLGFNSLVFLFIISGALRLLFTLFLRGSIKEVRTVPDFSVKKYIRQKIKNSGIVMWRYIGFKPIRIEN